MKRRNRSDRSLRTITIGIICSISLCNLLISNDVSLVASAKNREVKFSVCLLDTVINTANVLSKEYLKSLTIDLTEGVPEGAYAITFDSHTFSYNEWRNNASREVVVYPDLLYDAYENAPEMDFDYMNKNQTINVLWEFLVNQNGMDPILASSVIGHVCLEGNFGLKEGSTTKTIQDIQMARTVLTDKKCCGWGIIQWSFADRRVPLLTFYEDAWEGINKEDSLAWHKSSVCAECVYLLEEMNVCGIIEGFNNVKGNSTEELIESTVGYLTYSYVRYQDYKQDWTHSREHYRLTSPNNAGADRVKYAQEIYRYYMG